MSDDLSQLNARVDALELSLLQQEHRPMRVFYNLWAYRRDPVRRPATISALFSWLLSPGVVAGVGASVLAAVGVLIAYQANDIITDQNQLIREQNVKIQEQTELLGAQNQTALEEQKNNLHFQRLNRRTYLLTVLYDTNEIVRIKREALKEFLKLDRELKKTEVRNNPELYRRIGGEMSGDSDNSLDWHRLVTLHPELRTDLSGIVLRDVNMQFLDLSDIIFVDADLSCSDLRFAKLMHSDLTRTAFVGASMDGAKLDHATSTETDFSGTRLNGASLANTWLQGANFNMAFLRKTTFADYRNKNHPPMSAERAFVDDLHDINDSGGAQQFQHWARANGATKQYSYGAWQEGITRDVQAGRVTRHCE